jgi:hypothetical protein
MARDEFIQFHGHTRTNRFQPHHKEIATHQAKPNQAPQAPNMSNKTNSYNQYRGHGRGQ